jgi:dihydropyrimidine dehydrogenase (NAD+) subunit PreA
MLDHAIGPNIIAGLNKGLEEFLARNADKGWTSVEDFRGIRRERVVSHSQIKRPDSKEYFGGHDSVTEGYATAG